MIGAISISDGAALIVAGTVAGAVGSAGGITSLISYPALLAVGLPAFAANIANSIALIGSWPGSALGSRPELAGQASWVSRWAAVAAAGGATGAGLLLCTPSHVFARVVPFLVAIGSLALLIEPRLTVWYQRRGTGSKALPLAVGIGALSVYNGYFGAGSGVMTLTLLLVLVDQRLVTANALKNMLIGAASAAAAAILLFSGSVEWPAVLPMALGMLVGSRIGPIIVRHLPTTVLRRVIALFGMSLAVLLWLRPSS